MFDMFDMSMFDMLQADIYEIRLDNQNNKCDLLELNHHVKTNNDRIRDLKSDLKSLCTHEQPTSWVQRVFPSKDILMRSCNICDYKSELPGNSVTSKI